MSRAQQCCFASDLHGSVSRYEKLFDLIESERPRAVFLGGDLLPSGITLGYRWDEAQGDFLEDFLFGGLRKLRERLGSAYPAICTILGNDDPRCIEADVMAAAEEGLWHYVHERRLTICDHDVYGYAFVPPTPFRLKDWERYDVSRFVDPGCVSPEEGARSVPVSSSEIRYGTIAGDLDRMLGTDGVESAVLLFHSPAYETKLDRAALDGRMVDHAPLDVHVGSIAIRRMIEQRQPLLTLHGHIHESARITGAWRDRIGSTWMFSAAHDGPELAVVRFDLDDLESATRELR